MPDGKLMIEKSIENIDLDVFDRIVVVGLDEHFQEFTSREVILESFQMVTGRIPELVSLKEPTKSQSETIYEAIRAIDLEGAIYIKDCDNSFACAPKPINAVSTVNLNDMELIDAKNKSYVEIDTFGSITNIVEKEVISNYFCCGGYSFQSSKEFCSAFEEIATGDLDREVYVSHIIYKMLLDGEKFTINEASQYVDWGTLREYRHYCKQYLTVFCDVDGVLLKNGSKFSSSGWKTAGIKENLRKIADLQSEGRLFLVLTSSRPESEFAYTEEVLQKHGVRVDRYLFGLPHARRFLINDYSATNPYPSAVAINLERDSEILGHLFDD
jgi:hypothetical protein